MCYDDMADLTYLNDASVFANLRERYARWLIYVSRLFHSFLLCVLSIENTIHIDLSIILDLFGSVLCGHQSVQTFTHLHDESCLDVSRQKAN